MLPYAVVFSFLAIGALTPGRLRAQNEKPALLLLPLIVVTLFVGLRVQVGGDWYVYLRIFNRCAAGALSAALEAKITDPAYGVVNWFAGQAGGGIWLVNLICAAIYTLGLWSFCRMQTNPALAFLVAFPYVTVVVAMGYTRQSVALGLIMAAIAQHQKARTLNVIVLLLAAAAFHKSAVVVAPFFAVAEAKGRFKTFIAVGIATAIAFVVFLQSSVNDLIDNYVHAQYNSSGAGIRVAMNIVAAAIFIIYRKRIPFRPREYRLWFVFSVAVIATTLAFVYSPSSTAVDRTALYLLPLQITMLSRLPDIYHEHRNLKLTLLVAVVFYSMAVGTTWFLYGRTSFAWVPYRNYLWLPTHFVPGYHRR